MLFVSPKGIVHHAPHEIHLRRAAAIQVIGISTSQRLENLRKLGQANTAVVSLAASIHNHKDKMVRADDTNAGAGLVSLDGVIAKIGIDLNTGSIVLNY